MKILYLYSELVSYQIPIFMEFTTKYGAEVHVVSWDKNKLKPYTPPKLNNVTYYKRSEYTKKTLLGLATDINPDIIYISGWMDRDYLRVAKVFRQSGIPVVSGLDGQWEGNIRQRMAAWISPFLLTKYFSHAWVAGPYQYEFAKRIGFTKNDIIFNFLSCDTNLFSKGAEHINRKELDYPKSFLYVGNFRYVKGTDMLMEAFKIYRSKYNGNWKLICVGNGDLRPLVEGAPGVELLGFSSQDELVEITKRSGVFVLPSRHEQWGVVVHEFTSAAMPLILSKNVGAKAIFFIENFNGISFCNNSSENLAKAMFVMSKKDINELVRMCKNSYILSQKVTPQISAASFLSILGNSHLKDKTS